MNSGKYVFSQILDFVSRYEFEKCVRRYRGDYHIRELSCWNQFVQLFFGQITSLNSLRDICLCLKAHKGKLYNLGIKQNVVHTTHSRAGENRDWRIFADFGYYLIGLVRPLYADCTIPGVKIDNDVFAIDSTTISLSLKLFSWAYGKRSRGAVKIHTRLDLRGSIPDFILVTDGKYHDSIALDEMEFSPDTIYLMDRAYVDFMALNRIELAGAFFVTKAKTNMRFEVVSSNGNLDPATGLRSDLTICLTGHKTRRLYPEKLRLVEFWDADNDEMLTFLSNNFEVTALEIAELYRNRWQIEVFFRCIKQNLTIKKLWGHSENAVKIHIWVAISTYLIVAYIKYSLRSELSIYEMMQIPGISVFDKTPINELIAEFIPNQNVKEPQLYLFQPHYLIVSVSVEADNDVDTAVATVRYFAILLEGSNPPLPNDVTADDMDDALDGYKLRPAADIDATPAEDGGEQNVGQLWNYPDGASGQDVYNATNVAPFNGGVLTVEQEEEYYLPIFQ